MADALTAVGFKVDLRKTDRAGLGAAVLAPGGNYDVSILTTTAPVPDPNGGSSLGLFTGPPRPKGQNLTQVDFPDIDAEIQAANASVAAESCKHWANVQQAILKNYIVWPEVVPQFQWYGRGIDFIVSPNAIPAINLKRVR